MYFSEKLQSVLPYSTVGFNGGSSLLNAELIRLYIRPQLQRVVVNTGEVIHSSICERDSGE